LAILLLASCSPAEPASSLDSKAKIQIILHWINLQLFIMINNSSLQKWQRLQQKDCDQMFVNKLIEGLNCSPIEAKGILNIVYEVYQPFFDNSASLKPGQIIMQVVSIEAYPGKQLSESPMVNVTLTMDAGQEDLQIRKEHGVIGLRRHQLQRICEETFQQGGLLTVEDLAHRIFNCGERTITRDLAALRKNNIELPLRSTIKDMGRTISHRVLIVKEWLQGKEYSQINRSTNHSIKSVKNYVDKFKRVVCLCKQNYEFHSISFIVKLSFKLVEEYYNLYLTAKIVPHRKDELDELLKKSNNQI
jgi:hypothetical protein